MRTLSANLLYKTGLALAIAITVAFSTSAVSAQDDDSLPPPSTVISKEERQKLDAVSSIKDRTKLALQLMATRLANAEALNKDQNFDGVFRELGMFQGILDITIRSLIEADRRGNKVQDDLKRFEIGLRGFAPRVEGIRREMPVERDEYMGGLLKYLRDARAMAADALFDETVIRNQFTSRIQ